MIPWLGQWLERWTWPRAAIFDMQRDMVLVLASQVEILTRLKTLQAQLDRLEKDQAPPAG